MPVGSIGSTPAPRAGSQALDVSTVQRLLKAQGFDPGPIDGQMGRATRTAVKDFQRARGLDVDGVVGPQTSRALQAGAPSTPAWTPAPATSTASTFGPAQGERYRSRGTGYFPDSSAMEGGFVDRQGKPLHTLQDFLAGRSNYVSVAMDSRAFSYGTKLRIPELEAKYGRAIDFRVVDTGGAFRGKGTSRIDICTANARASVDPTINGPLTLVVQ